MKSKYNPILSLRIPSELLDLLRKTSEKNSRTVTQEVIRRLTKSFKRGEK